MRKYLTTQLQFIIVNQLLVYPYSVLLFKVLVVLQSFLFHFFRYQHVWGFLCVLPASRLVSVISSNKLVNQSQLVFPCVLNPGLTMLHAVVLPWNSLYTMLYLYFGIFSTQDLHLKYFTLTFLVEVEKAYNILSTYSYHY